MMMEFLVHHLLENSAQRTPRKTALIFGDSHWSYLQLHEESQSLATGLSNLGMQRHDRIGIHLKPGPELVQSIFAASMAGVVFVPIHHGLLEDQVDHIVQDCGIRVIITSSDLKKNCIRCSENSDDWIGLISVDEDDSADGTSGCFSLNAIRKSSPNSEAAKDDSRSERDLAAILYTSGSTGKAKGVMLSHRNIVAGAEIVADYLDITDKDRLLAALPFSFDAGLNQLTSAMQKGATLVLCQFVFGKQIVDLLIQHEITGLAGVPTLWCLLAHETSTLRKRTPTSLRYITNTGGVMPQHVLLELRNALPDTQVVLMYGLTEAFRSTYLPPDQLDTRPTSMGKAIPNTEILLINDKGMRCKPGEVGELVHHGPTVAIGYWGHQQLTDKVFRPHPFPVNPVQTADRVVYSGDLVKADEEGYFYFVSRKDNMIKTSGFRVSPTEVEEGLCKTAWVENAAVVSVPDPTLGQKIVAFVQAKDSRQLDVTQLQKDLATRLPAHMIPKITHVVPELPRNSSGKVNYAGLREAALKEMVDTKS